MTSAPQLSMQAPLKLRRIAVLTDFSQNAASALRCAAAIARKYRGNILLAHAYMPQPCAYAAPKPALVFQTLNAERQNLKNQLLAELRTNKLEGIESSVFLTEGAPVDLIRKLQGTDLIVVGTSGQTGLGKLALGSTAETVFRSASVPVLTVGPHCGATEEMAIRIVLYATDFSAAAEAAMPYALSIAKQNGAKLVLLHVASDQDGLVSFAQAMASPAPLEALHRLVPVNTDLKSPPSYTVAFGNPCKVILEKAKDLKAGIIVLGARRAKGFASVISHSGGGTAYRVAASAECPVLTVPSV
jgi:nucleotide-binding universal stress UspA family protein